MRGIDDGERIVFDRPAGGGELFGNGVGGHIGSACVLAVRMIVLMIVVAMRGMSAAACARVAMVVQMFGLRDFAVFAAIAFEHAGGGLFIFGSACVEQVENLVFKAEMRTEREGDVRVLLLEAFALFLDAFDQHASKQVHRDDADLRHAEQRLALHNALQTRPGDAGEGQVDEFVIVVLKHPARHARQFAVGAGIR